MAGGAWRVMAAWARGTGRGERLACAGAVLALCACAAAAAALAARPRPEEPDVAPHAWNVTRRMWLSEPWQKDEEQWPARFLPLRLVIVQHTAGAECTRFADCAASMRNLQDYYLQKKGYDVPYNFVVGNEARVYEGRGARYVAAHTLGYNRCALGLGFMGDYGAPLPGGSSVTPAQSSRARLLLSELARAGLLHERALVLGAWDVQATASPGARLYAELRTWPNAPPHPERFAHRSCDDIYDELLALDAETTPPATTTPQPD